MGVSLLNDLAGQVEVQFTGNILKVSGEINVKNVPTAGVMQIRIPVCNWEKLNCNRKPLMIWCDGLWGRELNSGTQGRKWTLVTCSLGPSHTCTGQETEQIKVPPLKTEIRMQFSGSWGVKHIFSYLFTLPLVTSQETQSKNRMQSSAETNLAATCMVWFMQRRMFLSAFNLFFFPKQGLSRNHYVKCTWPRERKLASISH